MNLTDIKIRISKITSQSLFKDTSWMLIARLLNVLVQAAYFVILARALGTENYGSFIGVSALASLVFPFVALGSDDVLVKEVAVNRRVFASYWGNTLLILLINSIIITSCLLLLSRLIFPAQVPLLTITCLLVADLLGLAILEAGNKAFRAAGLVNRAAQLVVINTGMKLLAVLCLITFFNQANGNTSANLNAWSVLYCVSSLLVSLLVVLTINKMVSQPQLRLARIKSDIAQGIYFSLGMSASNINNNIDKTMLASMAGLGVTGIYGSAYRFINIGDVPMLALFNASYPRFFQQGARGWKSCLQFAQKLLPLILAYGIVSFAAFQVFAPLLPKILGVEYLNAVDTLRWLAPLPFISALQLLIANILTGLGHQKIRSTILVISAGVNILLNLWLIPRFGLYGAIWATLASDTMRVMLLGIALYCLYNSSRKKANR